ncbi:collagen triple helix repeat-containing protein 1-like [Amphiura filiformis]|uniref:collagen triple helix repeat-containing protein 1-like n=1 Tax=Amphiura filiformis TaxID=82378 RepID=UPI003B2179F2
MAKPGITVAFLYYVLALVSDEVAAWGATCTSGLPGPHGPIGLPGPEGSSGAGELLEYTNWKQCTWNSANGDDYATIHTCSFTKQHEDSALYVVYSANMRLYGCSGCCKRWYFTFNNDECSPIPIDGVVYMENTNHMNGLKSRVFQGYCHNVAAGSVDVRVHVGDCHGYGNYDAYTGWNSVSRIIIKEVPKSPY